MSKTVHCCIDIRGMLKWSDAETRRCLKSITRGDGTRFPSVESFRESLLDELEKGHRVLPMSPDCEGFDFKTGCPGHEEAKAVTP